MDRIRNPFTAALGVSPAVLAGREEELDLITMAMLDGPGAHERVSVVSGARGSGKTVFLNAVEDRASQLDWTIISETATQGVVERIRNTAERNLQEFSLRTNVASPAFQSLVLAPSIGKLIQSPHTIITAYRPYRVARRQGTTRFHHRSTAQRRTDHPRRAPLHKSRRNH